MSFYLWLALGGAIGTLARFGLSGLVAQYWGETFPWGTLVINVGGSFLIGFFATLTNADGRYTLNATARHFVMTGVFGGFTTFSSFSLQTLNLAREGEWFRAGANSVASLVLCLLAVWLGYLAAVALNTAKNS
jgi:fluoride exporter